MKQGFFNPRSPPTRHPPKPGRHGLGGFLATLLAALAATCFLACGKAHQAPAGAQPSSISLAFHPELVTSIQLPPDSRQGREPGPQVAVPGPFRLRGTVNGVHTFEAPLPIRPRVLFFIKAPPGMQVYHDGKSLRFKRGSSAGGIADTWEFTSTSLRVRLRSDKTPRAGQVTVSYPRAQDRERSLNRRWADADGDIDFALRTSQQGKTSRHGVLLPAPGSITWHVQVPAAGHLSLDAGILEPETADQEPSDGARLRITLTDSTAAATTLLQQRLQSGEFRLLNVDLSAWAGQEVDLTMESQPLGDSRFDYVFLAEPLLYTPQESPPLLLMVFVDTLRPDHLGIYGYQRNTTPAIDSWASQATVFEQARSVAPWTLPSTRALLTGNEPELWNETDALPVILGRRGWTSAAFVGNVYLSSNFQMDQDWGTYYVKNWPRAKEQVDRALEWLKSHDDRPALLMVHFMDTHLPYTEPARYRRMFAGTAPEGMTGSFNRSSVLKRAKGKQQAPVRQYVKDRYDGSIRFVDDQVSRLLERVGPQGTTVFFADHGEEFWEHNGFEHGHSLYDELLRVPLAIRSPSLTPGHVEAPVSLMDLLPTLMDLLELDTSTLPLAPRGWSLKELAEGAAPAVRRFQQRIQTFGRPLYGQESWGVLSRQMKYTTSQGAEHLFDLGHDPEESSDLFRRDDPDPIYREYLSQALDWPVYQAFRMAPERVSSRQVLEAELTVPGGILDAWVGNDPRTTSQASVSVEGETAYAEWEAGSNGSQEIYVVPIRPPETVASRLLLTVRQGSRSAEFHPTMKGKPGFDGRKHRLLRGRAGNRPVTVTYAVAPRPPEESQAVSGFDPESREALKALGYMD